MVKEEIYFNEKLDNYTMKKEVDKVKSEKRKPIKFKLEDKTAKYRKQILKEEILSN